MAVLARLSDGPEPVSKLASEFDMALPSFMQHLRVLEQNGLVASTKKGRVRTYRMKPEQLEAAMGWLERRRRQWEQRLDQLDDYLQTMKKEEQ